METNEWKTAWQALDERLKKQELLRKDSIRRMIYAKSDKSLRRLLGWEILSIGILLLFAIPISVHILNTAESRFGKIITPEQIIITKYFFIFLIAFCALGVVWGVIKLKGLLKIDMSGNLEKNMRLINKYDLYIKGDKIFSLFLVPICSFFPLYFYTIMKANAFYWSILICLLIFALLCTIYTYVRFYKQNIGAIRKSLNELKELDEEETE